MRYMLIQDDTNPNNTTKMYYVMEDDVNVVIKIVDENCQECPPPVAHSIVDSNPPIPPCAQSNP